MPQQNTNTQQQKVVASPNPTVDDSKTPLDAGAKKVETAPARPVQSTTQAPMKSAPKKRKSRRHRT